MSNWNHWASKLEIGDKVVATIRHQTDGTKNMIGKVVIVVQNNERNSQIQAALEGVLYQIPYNELTQYEPTEASKVRCDICSYKWVAVRPVGLTRLECPNCSFISLFENVE